MKNINFEKRIVEANIIERVYDEVNNYYSKYNSYPNSLLIPYWMYDILKRNHIERFGKTNKKFKIMDLDLIPLLDETEMIKPISAYKGK